MASTRHIVFVQHGDYAEAVERFSEGGLETYAAQKYSVQFVADLARVAEVSVVCLPAPSYDLHLPNGVRALGMGWKERSDVRGLLRTLKGLHPTDLIVRTPLVPVIGWGVLSGVRVLPLLADSFGQGTGRMARWVLPALLNCRRISVVGNHNVFASRSLAALGVRTAKIVPWDWPPPRSPRELTPKQGPANPGTFHLFYAGVVSAPKGVGDVIEALGLLKKRGLDVRLNVAGSGELKEMSALAQANGVGERVNFLGRISNVEVFERMKAADAVVVPSRPVYPEGLPIVVTEGLCSRTPVVLSTHPVFQSAFGGRPGVMMFEAGRPEALAGAIETLAGDAELYARISQASEQAWEGTQLKMGWGELVSCWLEGSDEALEQLRAQSLERLQASPV